MKTTLLQKMLRELRAVKDHVDTEQFNEVLALLKQHDAELDRKGYTDLHPSRYPIVKLIEEAEEELQKHENTLQY